MAAKRKREAGQRKLSLLTGLAKLEGGLSRSPAVTELEDSDPYKFVGSQSMEVVDKSLKKKTSRAPSTKSVRQKPKKKADPPRQSLSEADAELELQEAEDIKRAIKASLQDMSDVKKRGEPSRKRKRGVGPEQSRKREAGAEQRKKREAGPEQSKHVQRRIKRAREAVEASEGENQLPTSKKDDQASPGSDALCEDPPSSFFESPPPPPTLPEETSAEGVVSAEHGRAKKVGTRKQATLPTSTASSSSSCSSTNSTPGSVDEKSRARPIPLSQLKSVSIKKLNLTKSNAATTGTASVAASTSAAEQETRSVDLVLTASGKQGASRSSMQRRKAKVMRKKVDGCLEEPPPPDVSEKRTRESYVTPVGARSNSPVLVQRVIRGVAVTPIPSQAADGRVSRPPALDGSRTTCLADADTPPLPPARSRLQLPATVAAADTTTLPASDCKEAERSIPRRKLSLSFKKKHRQVTEVSKKSSTHDDTIEIDSRMVNSPPAVKKASEILVEKSSVEESLLCPPSSVSTKNIPPAVKKASEFLGEKTRVEESLLSPPSCVSSKKSKPVQRKIGESSSPSVALSDHSPQPVKQSSTMASGSGGRGTLEACIQALTPTKVAMVTGDGAATSVGDISGSEREAKMAQESGMVTTKAGCDSKHAYINLSDEATADTYIEITEESGGITEESGQPDCKSNVTPTVSAANEKVEGMERHSKRPRHDTNSTKEQPATTQPSKQPASQVGGVTTPKRPAVQNSGSQPPIASTTPITVRHSATQVKESSTPRGSHPTAKPSRGTPQATSISSHPRDPESSHAPKENKTPQNPHPTQASKNSNTSFSRAPMSSQNPKKNNTPKSSHPTTEVPKDSSTPQNSHLKSNRPSLSVKESKTLKNSPLPKANPPPPPRYAVKGVSPAECSKVILGSFDSYFSQLMRAQSQVLWRVPWGEPIKYGTRQLGRRTRAARRTDSNLKFALKLGSSTKKARKQLDCDFGLNNSMNSSVKPLSRLSPDGNDNRMECGDDSGMERRPGGAGNKNVGVSDTAEGDSRSCKVSPERDKSSDIDIESADVGDAPLSSLPPQPLVSEQEWEGPGVASGGSSGDVGMDGIEREGVEEEAELEESCFDDIMHSIGGAGSDLEPSPIVISTQDDDPPLRNKTTSGGPASGPNDPTSLPDSMFQTDSDSQLINRIFSDDTLSPKTIRGKPSSSHRKPFHSTQSTRTPSPIPVPQTSRSTPAKAHSEIFKEIFSSSSPSPDKNSTEKPAASLHVISSPSPSPSPPSPQRVISSHSPSLSPTRTPVAEQAASPWLSSRRPPQSPVTKKNRKRPTPSRSKASKSAKKAKVSAEKKATPKSKRTMKSAAARLMQSRATVSSSESSGEGESVAPRLTRSRADASSSGSAGEGVEPSRSEAVWDGDSASSGGEGDGGHGGDPSSGYHGESRGKSSRAASSRRDASVIDLTDRAESSEDEESWPQLPCPLCNQMFDEGEIEAHAAECMGAETEEGKLPCPKCSKLFEGSLIKFHVEQCGGDSSDDEVTVRRRPIAAAASSKGRRKKKGGDGSREGANVKKKGAGASKGQLTLSRFAESARSSSPDLQIDEVVEISDPLKSSTRRTTDVARKETSSAATTSTIASRRPVARGRPLSRVSGCATPHASESNAEEAHGSEQQPLAIRCEDGGYMVDPSTISSSPIRTYTPLTALAPKERDSYQNQFQKTGKSRDSYGNQLRITGQSRNHDFDTLVDGGNGGGGGSGWNTKRAKRGGPAKQYKNWKPNWTKKNITNRKYYKKK